MESIRIPVGPGELFDRLTILEIKCRRIKDPVSAQIARQQLKLCSDACAAQPLSVLSLDATVANLRHKLREINESLWDAENRIRACAHAGDFGPEFVESACSIYRLNDRRSAVKAEIDRAFGVAMLDVREYSSDD